MNISGNMAAAGLSLLLVGIADPQCIRFERRLSFGRDSNDLVPNAGLHVFDVLALAKVAQCAPNPRAFNVQFFRQFARVHVPRANAFKNPDGQFVSM